MHAAFVKSVCWQSFESKDNSGVRLVELHTRHVSEFFIVVELLHGSNPTLSAKEILTQWHCKTMTVGDFSNCSGGPGLVECLVML